MTRPALTSTPIGRRTRRALLPALDALEGRRLLTVPPGFIGPVIPAPPTINPAAVIPAVIYVPFRLNQGDLVITGTSAGEYAYVTIDGRGTSSTADDEVVANLTGQEPARFPRSAVQSLSFSMGDGADTARNFTDLPSTIDGGAGGDTLVGGGGPDIIRGGSGVDTLVGGGDNDRLYGEGDRDLLQGDGGADLLDGGKDGRQDLIQGGSGADIFVQHYSDEFWYDAVYDGYEHESMDINNTPNDGDVLRFIA